MPGQIAAPIELPDGEEGQAPKRGIPAPSHGRGSVAPEGFFASVLALLTGGMIGQVIPLAAAPLLTRLYGPADFGEYALFSATVSILAIIATMRYELAIVLSPSNREAVNVLGLCVLLTLFWSALSLFVFSLFGQELAELFKQPQMSDWILLVPAALLFRGLYQSLNCWANRHGNFRAMAVSSVLQSGSAAVLALALGLFRFKGLMVGAAIAPLLGAIYIWRRTYRPELRDSELLGAHNLKEIAGASASYRRFPFFNFPSSLLNVISQRFFVYALVAFNNLRAAGLFGFSRSIVLVPISLLAQSLGRVFFREAALRKDSPRLEELTLALMISIARIVTPIVIFAMFWASEIFTVFFGKNWAEAGDFAAAFAPVAFLALFTTWPERIYEVYKRQDLVLKLQVISDTFTVALVYLTLRTGLQPLTAVVVYCSAQTLYHIAYLVLMFRVANFPPSRLVEVGSHVARYALPTAAILWSLPHVVSEKLPAFVIGAILIGAYEVIAARRLRTTQPFLLP